MMNKYLLYRITSQVNSKTRINNFSKWDCLENLLKIFSDYKVICIADNCDDESFRRLVEKQFYRLLRTSLGNSKSFQKLLNEELQYLDSNDLVYFVEDDYLHREGSSMAIEEGLEYFDYVSLYDHPDKYGVNFPDTNPFVRKGFFSENTVIVKGPKFFWRSTNSTTMTFGCLVKTIKKDIWVWNLFTQYFAIPRDFHIWVFLTSPNGFFVKLPITIKVTQFLSKLFRIFKGSRTLGIPLPSMSAHLEAEVLPDNFNKDFTNR